MILQHADIFFIYPTFFMDEGVIIPKQKEIVYYIITKVQIYQLGDCLT